jgi:Cof subfamily protein (haloacid dehalogenase superfamily)
VHRGAARDEPLDGVDVFLLSGGPLDLLPDRLYPPPAAEGRDLAAAKPLAFQVAGLRFVREVLAGEPGAEPAVLHAFEPAHHCLLPAALAADPRFVTVSTVAANAPVTQRVHRPLVARLLEFLGAGGVDLEVAARPVLAEDSPGAAIDRALAGTRLHQPGGPAHLDVFPLVVAYADLVDFVSPGQRDVCSAFQDSPVERLAAALPVARLLRERSGRLLAGGCGVSESWLARDPAAVDRAAVLRGLGLDPRRPVFAHTARYAVHHKGQLELFRAIEEVLATDPEVSFLIRCATGSGSGGTGAGSGTGNGTGGSGPAGAVANASFQRIADRHPGRVHLDWRLAGEDTLFEQAACADFCVHPSKFELDGFLIAQAEAMACGAVPIGTAQRVTAHLGHALPPGHPDATGFAVPGSFRENDDVLAARLAERIREAARLFREDRPGWARLSANARRVARSFTWERAAATRLESFAGIVAGREPEPMPVADLLRLGWFDALPDAAWGEHRAEIARAALGLGDLAAYARCATPDDAAYRRLFEAAYRRADFERAAAVARAAADPALTGRLRARRAAEPLGDGRWRVRYAHPEAVRVELALPAAAGPEPDGTAAVAGETAAETIASDEAATPTGTTLLPLARGGQGGEGFHAEFPDPGPPGRPLALMLTLASGRVTWDTVRLGGPPFPVVATDLDGTLLRDDFTVSARTRRALALAERAGARVVVATGRPAAACAALFAALGYRGLAVCGQGAQLYDAGRGRLLESARLGRDTAREVVALLEAELGPLELGVVTAPPASRFKVTPRFGERVRHGWDVTADRAGLWSEPIDKLILHHPDRPEAEVVAAATALAGDRITAVHSVRGMVEVLPHGTTKGAGLARAARLLGFTGEDVLAFGDMPNDIPLLAFAAHGVAVGNAHPELRAVADEIAPPNEEDGVAVVLERVFGPAGPGTPASPTPSLATGRRTPAAAAPVPGGAR